MAYALSSGTRSLGTDGDEALARRLQQEEEDLRQPTSAARPGMSGEQLANSASRLGMTDEQLAILLGGEEVPCGQREGDQRRTGGQVASQDDLPDEVLAALLQQEEEEEEQLARRRQEGQLARRLQAVQQAPHRALPGQPEPSSGTDCLPQLAASCGCGSNVPAPAAAASGCFAGCQLASCLGVGNTAMFFCTIGGGIIGFLSGANSSETARAFF